MLWCVDPDSVAPSTPRLAAPRVHTLPLDRAAHELTPILERFICRDSRHLPSVFVSADVLSRNAEAYLQVVSHVHGLLATHHGARITRQRDGYDWQRHLLQNLPGYTERRVPASWKDALRGLPAFVCGAGPSLDVSAPILAAHAGQAVVFSADSALRALHRHGVQADFAVSIDVAKRPEKCLPPSHPPHRVVLSAVSPPTWLSAADRESCYFLSSGQVTLDWLATQGVPKTELIARENCGNTALELARHLGCAPIYLFGLDLALDAGNPAQRHNSAVDATVYAASGFDAEQQHPQVPGNYAESVPTFALSDWRSLDERLAAWPGDLVINVNDRGARFRNTRLVHPADYSFAHTGADKLAALAALAASPRSEPAAAPALKHLRAIARRAALRAEMLRTEFRAHGPAGAVQVFREVLVDPEARAVFGAFSLKLMPHLLPPTEGDAAFWSALIDEFTALADLAAAR